MLKVFFILLTLSTILLPQNKLEKDTFATKDGKLEITFIGHGSLMFSFNKKDIYIDPFSKLTDFSKLPDADFIFITHEHGDHLDNEAISQISTKSTTIILTEAASEKIKDKSNSTIMKNGDTRTLDGIKIEAVPAYNLVHKRDGGEPFHPKGTGNGYIFTFGDKRVYVAGDTENIPEMKTFRNIDIAFLPVNLPYTMTTQMAADAAKMIHPAILYPYHYGDTNIQELVKLLKGEKEIEVRVRSMK